MPRLERDILNHSLVVLDHDGLEIARVSGDSWFPFATALARGYDREDANLRKGPDPWSPEFSDMEWEAMRRWCALVALRVAFESVIPGLHQITRCTTTDGDDPMHNPILRHFAYDHLPKRLQDVSRAFHALAASNAAALPDGSEKDMCLRKLLEAKDCAVRAALEGDE